MSEMSDDLCTTIYSNIYNGLIDHYPFGGRQLPFDNAYMRYFWQGLSGEQFTDTPYCSKNRAFYKAGYDIRNGSVSMGSPELINQWIAGEFPNIPGFTVSENYIRTKHTAVAMRYDGVIFFIWGAMPGHRFPETAVGLNKRSPFGLLRYLDEFHKLDHRDKRKQFREYVKTILKIAGPLPEAGIWVTSGELGLLKRVFGNRYSIAMAKPDMELLKSANIEGLYVSGIETHYALFESIDSAMLFKLKSDSDGELLDLTR